jgi:hypothetical protein
MHLAQLELPEQIIEMLAFGNEIRLTHQCFCIEAVGDAVSENILGVQDSDDVVDRLFIHRIAGVPLFLDDRI